MNKCLFVGRFVRDPKLYEITKNNNDGASGDKTAVVDFTLAISRKFKKGNGEIGKQTNYLDFEAWDSGAQVIANNFKKGDQIVIFASARNNSYEDSNGSKLNRVVFRVEEFALPSQYIENDNESANRTVA